MSNAIIQRISLLDTAHQTIRQTLSAGDLAIDATLGNGHDTLFLAQLVGAKGHVYGFDIQHQAVSATRLRLQQSGLETQASLFCSCHGRLREWLPAAAHGRIKAVMFNLGYLPGGDKNLITRSPTTLAALDAAGSVLAADGVITVLAYPGHHGGDAETQALQQWIKTAGYGIEIIQSQHPHTRAPVLFVIRKQPAYLL